MNCCNCEANNLQIFIPSLEKEDLKNLIHFIYVGEIVCKDQAPKILANLNEVFGFSKEMVFFHNDPQNNQTPVQNNFSTSYSPKLEEGEIEFDQNFGQEKEILQTNVDGNTSPKLQSDFSKDACSIPKKEFVKNSTKAKKPIFFSSDEDSEICKYPL